MNNICNLYVRPVDSKTVPILYNNTGWIGRSVKCWRCSIKHEKFSEDVEIIEVDKVVSTASDKSTISACERTIYMGGREFEHPNF